MQYRWTCTCCNKEYDSLPLDYGFQAPDYWVGLSEEERNRLGRLDRDVCTVRHEDGRHIFIRGCLEIPIIGSDERLVWGVWVSVSEQSFARILELWDLPVGNDEPPRFGWLCNSIQGYPDTLHLPANIRLRNDGIRPAIELHRSAHPLCREQENGISLGRVEELAAGLRVH
ncbi:MAG TPA: DUF2199 domain-containing protein [Dongiaceae bacterium]|nr:DUF2199 domain-containing protein [Dongiaceae bacterium]